MLGLGMFREFHLFKQFFFVPYFLFIKKESLLTKQLTKYEREQKCDFHRYKPNDNK